LIYFIELVKKIDSVVDSVAYALAIPDRDAVEALCDCDVIVGCVDTFICPFRSPKLASRYLIPYIDIGATVSSRA